MKNKLLLLFSILIVMEFKTCVPNVKKEGPVVNYYYPQKKGFIFYSQNCKNEGKDDYIQNLSKTNYLIKSQHWTNKNILVINCEVYENCAAHINGTFETNNNIILLKYVASCSYYQGKKIISYVAGCICFHCIKYRIELPTKRDYLVKLERESYSNK